MLSEFKVGVIKTLKNTAFEVYRLAGRERISEDLQYALNRLVYWAELVDIQALDQLVTTEEKRAE